MQLRSVVDVAGRIEEVRQKLAEEGLIVDGSKGQPRENPLLGAETRLRGELAQRLREWRIASGSAAPGYY